MAIPEKNNEGAGLGGGRDEDMEFQKLSKNSMWNFQGLIKKKWNFQGWPRKKNVHFPGVLVFGLGNPRDLTQFCGISRGGALFCLEFPEVK